MSSEKGLNVSGASDAHFYPLVIDIPEVGKVLIEETDPEKVKAVDKHSGYHTLIRTFQQLQELDDPKVNEILRSNRVRYEEPGW